MSWPFRAAKSKEWEPNMSLLVLVVTVASILATALSSASENVYISSSYGQLVTSSTLRWQNTNNSNLVSNTIRLDETAVCRGWYKNKLVPGNTVTSGKCQIGFSGELHTLDKFQVLVDPAATSRLEWRKWDIFTKRPYGQVSFLEEDAFIARHFDRGRYRFGDLNHRRGLSGNIAIFFNEGTKVQHFYKEGDILVEVEPIKYKLEDVDFIIRRVKVSKNKLMLGSRVLSNVIHDYEQNQARLLYGWDSIRSVIAYNATYNYYWGQFPGLIKALPSSSRSFSNPRKISFKWGLPLVFTRHRIIEISHSLQPGTSIQVIATALNTTTEVPYTGKLIFIYEDGKIKKKRINGTYIDTLLSQVDLDYGRPYFTHNGTYAPTTTPTTTTTTSTTTPSTFTTRAYYIKGKPPKLSTPRPRRTTTQPPTEENPLRRFYPQIDDEMEEKDKKNEMQSDQASKDGRRSPLTAESLVNAGARTSSWHLGLVLLPIPIFFHRVFS